METSSSSLDIPWIEDVRLKVIEATQEEHGTNILLSRTPQYMRFHKNAVGGKSQITFEFHVEAPQRSSKRLQTL
jgi:hypothetical protein